MMRRDAKAMVAYSGPAELKAALDPRQRVVDEITPVGRSMAEVSRGEPLLSSAGHAAPLTGGFTASPRALAKSCGRVATIGNIARAFGVMGSRFHRQARGRQWHQPSLWQVLDLFQLGCISKMRGTDRSARVTARLRASLVPLPNGGPECRTRKEPQERASGLVDKGPAMGVSAPRCCQAALKKWRRARGRTFN